MYEFNDRYCAKELLPLKDKLIKLGITAVTIKPSDKWEGFTITVSFYGSLLRKEIGGQQEYFSKDYPTDNQVLDFCKNALVIWRSNVSSIISEIIEENKEIQYAQ